MPVRTSNKLRFNDKVVPVTYLVIFQPLPIYSSKVVRELWPIDRFAVSRILSESCTVVQLAISIVHLMATSLLHTESE